MSKESSYILKRRIQAMFVGMRFLLMRIFPIKNNKIVVSAFEGDGGFCCNPRYIIEELHKRKSDLDIIWLTKKGYEKFPHYIKIVKYSPWNIAYHLTTAKVWIDNYRKPYGALKRKNQIYIQTWHASIGFKAVGLYRGDKFPKIAQIVSEWDSKLANYFLSNSDYCNRVYPQKLLYSGPTLKVGSPRVDCMINDKEKLRGIIRERYHVSLEEKLLLFAPTFRGGNQKGKKQVTSEIPSIDFSEAIDALQKRFGGVWSVCLRLHPQLSARIQEMPLDSAFERFIDVSQEPDISEIMAGCDMVITDYSSCAFDACFAGIPVLLYADDVQEYIRNRGKFMWKPEDIPFLMAESNQELIENIMKFDQEEYQKQTMKFMCEHGVIEDGKASARVADKILSFMNA